MKTKTNPKLQEQRLKMATQRNRNTTKTPKTTTNNKITTRTTKNENRFKTATIKDSNKQLKFRKTRPKMIKKKFQTASPDISEARGSVCIRESGRNDPDS